MCDYSWRVPRENTLCSALTLPSIFDFVHVFHFWLDTQFTPCSGCNSLLFIFFLHMLGSVSWFYMYSVIAKWVYRWRVYSCKILILVEPQPHIPPPPLPPIFHLYGWPFCVIVIHELDSDTIPVMSHQITPDSSFLFAWWDKKVTITPVDGKSCGSLLAATWQWWPTPLWIPLLVADIE